MDTLNWLVILLLTTTATFGQIANPPGTIKVHNFYMDYSEVPNIAYREYLHTKKDELDSLAYQKLLPDSINYWFTDPNYVYKPITNITKQQAELYCEWRSKVVREMTGLNVTFRLPTPQEWLKMAQIDAAKNNKKLKRKLAKLKNEFGENKKNLVYLDHLNISPPYKNFEHVFDNVSEMTSDDGLAMGANNGNLLTLDENLNIRFEYSHSGVYLGFRCLAEVKE